MRRFWLFAILIFQSVCAQEKDSVSLPFRIKFGNETLTTSKKYISANKDTLTIDVLKLYISNIELEYADGSFSKSKKAQLLDIENLESLKIKIAPKTNKSISKVTFNIGIDSLSSVSGALSGDLDPTKGMYWAWQSGFINMKIEGKSSSCKTRKNEFQFHIGGYLKPNYAMRKIMLVVTKPNPEIAVDFAKLFSKIKLSESNSIMIPGKPAMEIADYSTQMFTIE